MGLTFSARRRNPLRRFRTAIALVVVLVVAAGGVLYLVRSGSAGAGLPTRQVDAFLAAWSAGDTSAMATFIESPPPDLATAATSLVQSAPGSRARYTRTTLVRAARGGGATATYHATVDLTGFGPFEWNGTLPLVRVKQAKTTTWEIAWEPGDLYPGLRTGEHLAMQRVWPTRAAIVADDGSLLAGSQKVVKIGLEPDRITKTLKQIKKVMQKLVGTDPASIDAALHGPGVRPNYFVQIATVPDDTRYHDVLRPQLAPIAGVFFQHDHAVLAPQDALGAQMVGSVGAITKERLQQLGAPYRAGDLVGLGGLQAAFESRLAGRPAGTVVVEAGTKVVRTVKQFPGRDPAPVDVSIDPGIQRAADSALAGEPAPAALVALDATTGQIRALVSKPDNGFDRAVDGAYPPGSTFKVITSTALLAAGRAGSTPAPCPPTRTVDGETFKNFEGEASGAIDLAQAFKISCNNAFIGLADQLPGDALAKAAASYGFNVRWSLPVPSYGGTFPKPRDRAELAASAIGQGRVLASPLQMAAVAAAVDSGRWHAPTLITMPASSAPSAPPIDAGVLSALRGFMATVEQPGGTADGAGLPPGVFGKTGTAEFGHADPPQTHAWFIGYRGNVAFAVIVEGGGIGGRVAPPIAARFLSALPG